VTPNTHTHLPAQSPSSAPRDAAARSLTAPARAARSVPAISLHSGDATLEAVGATGTPSDAAAAPAGGMAIRFEEVRFAYPARPEAPVLRGLRLEVAPGRTLALVGPSGGGKSTVVALIQRFYDPQRGRVLVGGVDVRGVSRESFMRHVACVMQEPVLFARSIRDNILVGAGAATRASDRECDAKIEAAARSAHAWDFVQARPPLPPAPPRRPRARTAPPPARPCAAAAPRL